MFFLSRARVDPSDECPLFFTESAGIMKLKKKSALRAGMDPQSDKIEQEKLMMDQNHVQTHAGPYSLSVFYKLSTRFDYALLKWNYLIICWGEALLLMGLGALFILRGTDFALACFLIFGGSFFFVRACATPKIIKSMVQHAINEIIEENFRSKTGYTIRFSFGEDAFEVSTENSWSRLNYAECYGYLEDPEFLFVQPQKNKGYPLEKKHCDPELLDFLKQKLTNREPVKPSVKAFLKETFKLATSKI